MPKEPTQSSSRHSGTFPNVLKRNQACHQCRRRKLKCDAKRPCSTCVRSHAHAIAHAPAGQGMPSEPDCSFDEPSETPPISELPKNKYERLENRISELEAILRQRDASSSLTSPRTHSRGASGSPRILITPTAPEASNGGSTWKVGWSAWPPDLPNAELLRHLVEVFFLFHPHATRLLHHSTFLGNLALPPSHPKFPAAPILHAICAVGSLYTGMVTSPPLPNLTEVEPDEIFSERHRVTEDRPDSFAEQQVKLAKDGAKQLEILGQDLLQALQTYIICCWFYVSHSKHVELFSTCAEALRLSMPLGLNMCPPFTSITISARPPSILPVARTVIEDELRRNAFWLAYANERQHGCTNGWAHCLDDQDISQLMPLRKEHFDAGKLVTPHDRQWAHGRNLLNEHPDSQTDSFILYVKATMLLSRVKTFNMRFRIRYFNGDKIITTQDPPLPVSPNSTHSVDARASQGFIALDNIVSSFLHSLPSHLRDSIADNVVDNHLHTACLMPHVACIVLHDPHADVRHRGCVSALKIMNAARAILDLMYKVCSTSYDITLLDPFCSFCWFTSGRVLIKFLHAATEANSVEQIATLRAELEFILALHKVGQRYPMAYRCAKMIESGVSGTPHQSPISAS